MREIIAKTCCFASEEQEASYYAFVEGIREKEEALIVGGVDEVLKVSKGNLVFFGEIKDEVFSIAEKGSGFLYTTVKNLADFYEELVKVQDANPKVDFVVLAGEEEKEFTVGGIFTKESSIK